MKYAYFFIAIFSTASVFCTPDDALGKVIEDSDPKELYNLLIPGYFMSLDAKNRYVKQAQEITNQTHAELHQFKFSDLGSCIKALTYGAAGGTLLALALDYCILKKRDIKKFLTQIGPFRFIYDPQAAQQETSGGIDSRDESIFGGALAALGIYFSAKSLGLFHRLLTKQNRTKTHHDALAVEAIIQRLPAFDNGCFIPGSSN